VLKAKLSDEVGAHQFYQYAFFSQWRRIRAEAAKRGIGIIGDIPIFVAADSADAWSSPGLFELGKDGRPVAVAGVPPDYFSADGQLWGNPLYRWDVHAKDGYAWWKSRLGSAFEMCDIVRIDHFRGFDAYWRIPLPAENAKTGEWRPGPGLDFFRAVRRRVPGARIIAEDLGLLTPSVEELLADTGLPGMAVLQFAFGGDAKNPTCPTTSRATRSSIRARTTTTRRSAGTPPRTRRRATMCGATCGSRGPRPAGTSSARPTRPCATSQ
jgi:4-alpha-glucanotransferase